MYNDLTGFHVPPEQIAEELTSWKNSNPRDVTNSIFGQGALSVLNMMLLNVPHMLGIVGNPVTDWQPPSARRPTFQRQVQRPIPGPVRLPVRR
jgi:hypothetical protein